MKTISRNQITESAVKSFNAELMEHENGKMNQPIMTFDGIKFRIEPTEWLEEHDVLVVDYGCDGAELETLIKYAKEDFFTQKTLIEYLDVSELLAD